MSNNVTNPNNLVPPASQADAQSIPGQIIVQARPIHMGFKALSTNSITGSSPTSVYDDKKGKGNN